MDEKIIIKSKRNNVLYACLTVFFICAVIAMIPWYELNTRPMIDFFKECIADSWDVSKWQVRIRTEWLRLFGFGAGIGAVCALIFYWWTAKTEITLTNKRVYGKTVFGKRVDLPFDSVSAVGSCWLKGIGVATSSGRIKFLLIENRDEIHKCITDLLIERQSKTAAPEAPKNEADVLKKYKELLDSGIITQEEFNAKKKQLLGL